MAGTVAGAFLLVVDGVVVGDVNPNQGILVGIAGDGEVLSPILLRLSQKCQGVLTFGSIGNFELLIILDLRAIWESQFKVPNIDVGSASHGDS